MFLTVGALFLLLGIGCLMASALLWRRQRRPAAISHTAAGVVVGLRQEDSRPGDSPLYAPKVEFGTAAGTIVRFVSASASAPARHTVGQRVRVRYDPQAPETAEIDSSFMPRLVLSCLAVIGVLAALLGVLFLGMELLLATL